MSWEGYEEDANSWVPLTHLDGHPLTYPWRSNRTRAALRHAAYWTPPEILAEWMEYEDQDFSPMCMNFSGYNLCSSALFYNLSSDDTVCSVFTTSGRRPCRAHLIVPDAAVELPYCMVRLLW